MVNLRERRNSISLLKGIAIITVTLFHFGRTLGVTPISFGSFDLTNPFKNGDIGVNLFIYISGFLFLNSISKSQGFYQFIKKKFTSLSPLYFAAIFFYYIFSKMGYPLEEDYGMSSVLLHLTYLHTLIDDKIYSLASVLWYMGLIIQLYIVGYVVDSLGKRNKLFGILFVSLLYYINFNVEFPLVTRRFVGGYLLIFYLGVLSNKYYDKIILIFNKKWIYYTYLTLFFIYIFNINTNGFINYKYMDFPEGFIYLFFPLWVLFIENLKGVDNIIFNFVVYIGEISFTLYLFNYAYRILHLELGLKGVEGVIIYSLFLLVFTTIIENIYKRLKESKNGKKSKENSNK